MNTSAKRSPTLSRNVIWNVLGSFAPLLVAIAAVPLVIAELGLERFGVLTLIWAVLGYFNLFDFGVGQALTKLLAERRETETGQVLAPLVWTGMSLLLLMGLIAAVILWFLTPWLVLSLLKIPEHLKEEVITSFYWLCLGLPIVITTAGLRGILEAYQEFKKINLVRIPLGVLIFIAPLLVLPFSSSLVVIMWVLLAGRLLAWLFYLKYSFQTMPALMHKVDLAKEHLRPLITFGGWMTVSGVIGPVMVYFDRFVIGAVVSMAAVAYYVTPHEVVSKLWIFPSALVGVLFPALAASLVNQRSRVAGLLDRGQTLTFFCLLPIIIMVYMFAEEGLAMWLSDEFAEKSFLVLRLLIVGVFINCMAAVPSSLIKAAGRPDLNAKLHLVELPFYLIALWYTTVHLGIVGAAWVWLIRVVIDTVVLFLIANSLLPEARQAQIKHFIYIICSLLVLLAASYIQNIPAKFILVFVVGLISLLMIWSDIKQHGTFSTPKDIEP